MTPEFKARMDALLSENRIVLFMKGEKGQPACGFSFRVVSMLNQFGIDYETVNVLADMEVRSSMKEYSSWPTFPQLYVEAELIGGCDIITQMFQTGELGEALGATLPKVDPPNISVSDAAAEALNAAKAQMEQEGTTGNIFIEIDERFAEDLYLGPADANSLESVSNGVSIFFSRDSAKRAEGLTIDYQDSSGFSLHNPNKPASVQHLSVQVLSQWIAEHREFYLYDVRGEDERQIAKIPQAIPFNQQTIQDLEDLPKDATLVFQCHHGMRSMSAAQQVLSMGYTKVYNLSGGIHAWSTQIDPAVPVY